MLRTETTHYFFEEKAKAPLNKGETLHHFEERQ